MFGLEVFGVLVSASQLTDCCITIIASLRDVYRLVHGKSNRYRRQLEQVQQLIETAQLVKATETFHTPSVENQLDSILVEARRLQRILDGIVSELRRKSTTMYLKAVFNNYHEREMHKGFASLNDKKSTLTEILTRCVQIRDFGLSLLSSKEAFEIKRRENLRSARVVTSTVGKINPATKRHYEVPGNLNGAQVTAFPDTGAEKNVISLDFAVRNKFDIQRHSQLEFQLPTGKASRSVGTAYLPWKFADEPKVFNILFSVLPECTHDVIIGGKFLSFTQTLTKFAHRIKTKLLPFPPRLGVKLLGSQRQRVWGTLDEQRAAAVPDTGSDVMLVSTAYAMQRGFKISGQKDCRSELEFADGSRAFTRGLVKDVDWSFDDSDTSYQCDFHVLDNLPVDVVLSNDFLFDVNAFSEYDSSFFDADDVSAQGYVELSLVKQISWLGNRIQKFFSRKTQEGTSKISGCLTLDILLMYVFL